MVIENYIRILLSVWEATSGFASGVLGVLNSSIAQFLLNFKDLVIENEIAFENGLLVKIVDLIAESSFAQDTTLLTIMFGSGFAFFIGYQIITWFGNLFD